MVHPKDEHAASGFSGERQIPAEVDAEPIGLAEDGKGTQAYLGEEMNGDVPRDDKTYGPSAHPDLECPGGAGHVRARQVDEQLSCEESL